MTPTNTRQATIPAQLLMDNLPLGVFVVDRFGSIHHMNRRAAIMTGYVSDNLLGRSILEFVAAEELDFLAKTLTHGPDYPGQIMGPLRIRYRTADGSTQWTECWSYECPPEFGIEGYIVTMSTESVTDNLAKAAYDIAVGEPLELSLGTIARAVHALPLNAEGTILVRREGRLDLIGEWPFPDRGFVDDVTMPWHIAWRSSSPIDVDVDDLTEKARRCALNAGYQSIWIRPVVTQSGNTAAVFVVWRNEPGPASPNQERHSAEAVGVARLAFEYEEHRAQLEREALTDHLTGLGNRVQLARNLSQIGETGCTALYIDLDRFKQVNDSYGHDVGDLLLRAAGQRIMSVVRSTDSVFRMGGDEFIVLCTTPSVGDDVHEPHVLAQRIVDLLGTTFVIDGLKLHIGASVGVAVRREGDIPEQVIRRADWALLTAKRAGKSRWCSAERPDPVLQPV